MAEQPSNAIGLEGLRQLQEGIDKLQLDVTNSKNNVTTTVARVEDDQEIGAAVAAIWKQGDPEMTDPEDPRPQYTQLQTGELAPASTTRFVKLKEFEKFYAHVDDKHHEVKKWFDKSILYARHWDFFYIYAPLDIQPTAILLLPLPRAEHFLRTINRHLHTSITMPSHVEAPGLVLDSPVDGTPRPRYIACSTEPEDVPSVKIAIPHRSYVPESESHNYDGYKTPTEEDILAFRAKMHAMSEVDREKKERERAKREERRHQQQKAKGYEILRAQRYLGLRKKNDPAGNSKQGEQEDQSGSGPVPEDEDEYEDELDVDQVTPYPQESSVIFICIDIEAFEFPPHQITEVGIATLDTVDIAGIAPGKNGCNWFKNIRAKHFITAEWRRLQNKVHCQGNRDGFVFERSEYVYAKDLKEKILACFKPPFSKTGAQAFSNPDLEKQRNIVFVGHDAKQDLDYLKRLDVDLSLFHNIIDLIDSSNMYQSLRRDAKTSLGNTLMYLDLIGYNLHNGGNDAVYTLHAMIGIAVKAEVDKDKIGEEHEIELEKRIEAERDHASKVVRQQKEGWELDSEDDGGEVQNPLAQFAPKRGMQQPQKPKIMDSVKGLWTGDLAQKVPNAQNAVDAGPWPRLPSRQVQQPRVDPREYSTWRAGINVMKDEDIE